MRRYLPDPHDPKIVHLRPPPAGAPRSLLDVFDALRDQIKAAQTDILAQQAELTRINANLDDSVGRLARARAVCEGHAKRARQVEQYATQAEQLVAAGDIEGCVALAQLIKSSMP